MARIVAPMTRKMREAEEGLDKRKREKKQKKQAGIARLAVRGLITGLGVGIPITLKHWLDKDDDDDDDAEDSGKDAASDAVKPPIEKIPAKANKAIKNTLENNPDVIKNLKKRRYRGIG
jgi:hypothetical protein